MGQLSASQATSLPVDLIRAVAIILVILLHAAIEPFPITPTINQDVIVRWVSVDIYDSIARVCVPLFVLLSGALLLPPYKVSEPIGIFLKKRFIRVGLPFIFWAVAYFLFSHYADNQPLTLTTIGKGILQGPYYHFWFIYMLFGLYLITPILRVLIAHANRKILRYLLVLWFIGVGVVPIINLASGIALNSLVFVIGGWVGYFVLGFYLQNVQVRAKTLWAVLLGAFALTAAGTYFINYYVGGSSQYFFFDFLSINVILASVAAFILLKNIPVNFGKSEFSLTNRIVHFIGQSSLAIYLMHIIILESLQRGYFGVQISISTMNPIIEIPLVTAVTLIICLAILYPISKVSALKKIIGIKTPATS
jgi:surface polysaccharide O-acyltransferase-like enzyme